MSESGLPANVGSNEGLGVGAEALPDDLEFLKGRVMYWETNLLEYLHKTTPAALVACVVSILSNRDAADRYMELRHKTLNVVVSSCEAVRCA